jgi:hypothetical protein
LIWQNAKRFLTQRAQAKYERAHVLAQKEWEREKEKESDKEREKEGEKEGEKNTSYYGYTENNRFFTPSSFTDLGDKPYDVVVGTNYGIKVNNSISDFLFFFCLHLTFTTTSFVSCVVLPHSPLLSFFSISHLFLSSFPLPLSLSSSLSPPTYLSPSSLLLLSLLSYPTSASHHHHCHHHPLS